MGVWYGFGGIWLGCRWMVWWCMGAKGGSRLGLGWGMEGLLSEWCKVGDVQCQCVARNIT